MSARGMKMRARAVGKPSAKNVQARPLSTTATRAAAAARRRLTRSRTVRGWKPLMRSSASVSSRRRNTGDTWRACPVFSRSMALTRRLWTPGRCLSMRRATWVGPRRRNSGRTTPCRNASKAGITTRPRLTQRRIGSSGTTTSNRGRVIGSSGTNRSRTASTVRAPSSKPMVIPRPVAIQLDRSKKRVWAMSPCSGRESGSVGGVTFAGMRWSSMGCRDHLTYARADRWGGGGQAAGEGRGSRHCIIGNDEKGNVNEQTNRPGGFSRSLCPSHCRAYAGRTPSYTRRGEAPQEGAGGG